ncbi:MAG: FAD-dependent oxidoreductase [Caulobacterales bacterium]
MVVNGDAAAAAEIAVVGTGAAGLIAAIAAASHGLKPIVFEKSSYWGGTTAMSGGALWIPGHSLMEANGVKDDLDAARRYLDSNASQSGKESTPERRDAYLKTGPEMVDFLAAEGFEWEFSPFPDYYIEAEGAAAGRGVGPAFYDGARLGEWRKTMQSAGRIPQLAINGDEVKPMLMATQNVANLMVAARVMLRTQWWRARGKHPMFVGQALVGRLMEIVQKKGIEVRLATPVTDLIYDGARVCGVRYRTPGGKDQELRTRAGVVLCAGGFARDEALRQEFQGLPARYTAAVETDTGDALKAAMKLGADTALLDDAWWIVCVVFPDGSRNVLLWERTFPHSLIVDPAGKRYVNEAGPYNDVGREMYARGKQFGGKPSWLIMDARHRRDYVFTNILGRVTPSHLIDAGFFIKADTLEELARKCELPIDTLRATIDRFNRFAREGKDADFGRGDHVFDTIYGDEKQKPNSTLGEVSQAPFWAVRVYPGDLGTKGGLVTDADGRVLTGAGEPIPGLYASGNTTASVMGRGYPGPGSTLGPGAVFAYRAARHAAATAS